MMRCEEGHFYDAAKHSSCPWCAKALDLDGPAVVAVAEGKTRPLAAVDAAVAPPPRAAVQAHDHAVTRRFDAQPTGIDPVVGWLVCIDGPEKGRDYRLHSERNFVGRAASMDVCIAADPGISREKHATITFEPRKKAFWLHPGEASGLVYRNDSMVNAPVQLETDDLIELGKSKLVLVPFTSQRRTW